MLLEDVISPASFSLYSHNLISDSKKVVFMESFGASYTSRFIFDCLL